MNLTEQRSVMGGECHFLPVSEDHVNVAGSLVTAVTFAALMYRSYGDGGRIELTISEIIKAQGVWAQSRSTVIRSMATLFKRGVIVRSAKGGRDNRYAFTLNQERIRSLVCGSSQELPVVPGRNHQNVPVVPPRHIPNKEVRDFLGIRNKKETHPPSPSQPTEAKKPLGGWGPFEDQIQKTIAPYARLFREPFNVQTVRNLADAFRGKKDGDGLVGQLAGFLAGIAGGLYQKPTSWGAIVWRARTWQCLEARVRREPDVELVYLIDQVPEVAERKPPGSETQLSSTREEIG